MTEFRKSMVGSSFAFALSLSACGGGTSSVGSMPAPPATATPAQTAASISAPAAAIAPNANLFPLASSGGPTTQSHPSTLFPLLQSVVSIAPGSVAAGTTTMSGGASLTYSSPGNSYQLDVGNPALGISHAQLTPSPSGSATVFQADLGGGATAFLDIVDPGTSNLSWTSYGFWDVHAAASYTNAAFTTGYIAPDAAVPTSGTATYHGSVIGEAFHPNASGIDGVDFYQLSGDASMEANFGTGAITGDLNNMITRGFEGDTAAWNSVSLAGSITGSRFSGTSAVTSTPANSGSLNGAAKGTFGGRFYGPTAGELGAVWTLYDGMSSAVGSIGATTSSTGSPWKH